MVSLKSAGSKAAFGMVLLAGLVAAAPAAQAVEVAGSSLDDQVTVNSVSMVLNGAGLRSEFGFVSVYVAALYTVKKSSDAGEIIDEKSPRRLLMVMKRTVGADKMLNAFHKGIAANLTATEQQTLKPRLDELDQAMMAIKEVKEGDRVTLDFGADGNLSLRLNGQAKETIAGPGIAPALLKIWLGAHPAQDDLKKALLGQ